MNELSSEAKQNAAAAGCCAVGLGVTMIAPSYVSGPIFEAAMDTSIEMASNSLFKDGKKPSKSEEINQKEKLEKTRGGETIDAVRGLMAVGVVGLVELPQVFAKVVPHMAEFSQSVPNWVPEVAAAAAFAYGLSYLAMRHRRIELQKSSVQK